MFPGVGNGSLFQGIDLEFEAAQLFGVTLDTYQHAAVLHEGLGDSVVCVPGDQHRDFGGLGEKTQLFLRCDVAQQDDEIALCLQFRGILACGGERRNGVPLLHGGRNGESLQLIGHGANDGDAQPIHREDHIRLGGEELTLGADDVGGHDGVLRNLHELARLHPAVVEIVVAERPHVVAEQVDHLEDGEAVEDGGDRGALGDIAGIQQDAIVAAGAFAADHGGQVRKAATAIFERQHAGVEVVGVQDGEGPDFGG